MASHGDGHGCPPPAILVSSCGPSRSTRVWGERATRRDLLSPCPVQASMIAHFPLENEDLAGALPASSSRGSWLSSSARPSSPRLSRGHREALLLTAGGRGALLLCGTAGSKSGSEIPHERHGHPHSLLLYSNKT